LPGGWFMRNLTSLTIGSLELESWSSPITRDQARKACRSFAWLLALTLVSAIGVQAAFAESAAPRGLSFTYDPAREISSVGTVMGFVAQPAGGPVGVYLLVSVSGTIVDAHLGPYFSKANQQALRGGQLVQVVGVRESSRGGGVLLVRQLVFQGRLVTVRNERGFLIGNRISERKNRDGNSSATGGIQ